MHNLTTKNQVDFEAEAREHEIKKLVADVERDFEIRQKERLNLERQWELNMNFFAGNQYCNVSSRGEIVTEGKSYYWQNRSVYNHIAPLVESRLARFSRVTPTVYVRPQSDDDKDVAAAALSEKILWEVFKKPEVERAIKNTTAWSETCGTAFYKVVWDNKGGNVIGEVDGEKVFEGDVKIISVSPFEIFPDNLYASDLSDCASLIHARAVSVDEIKEKYGLELKGGDVRIFGLNQTLTASGKTTDGVKKDSVIVIERYQKKSELYPNGRLTTVAAGTLLYDGELPYINGANGERIFPFVMQTSQPVAGNFFGVSIVERLIPVQRAYNAVKNRKHEFMNRLSMGIVTVEDGSVDVDDLEDEGLSPGKILVYRQGSKAPELMPDSTMPDDFNKEEENLLNEFVVVSGVCDVSSSSDNARLSSGSALEILIDQDNTRLLTAAEDIRRCYLEIARQVIRLYAQFTVSVRAVRYQDDNNKTKVYYADENAVRCDDVYLESENELLYTHSQKKEMIFKLYESGLLTDENGFLRSSTKEKILSLLGYKDLDYQKGMARLQEEKAQDENDRLRREDCLTDDIDDDAIHIDEHTRFVLCEYRSLSDEQKQRYYAHINEHKQKIKEIKGE